MHDLCLIFPPQWSPFQPPLSVPSLSAWLTRAGYSVRSVDLNIAFFHWLLSDDLRLFLLDAVDSTDLPELSKEGYRQVFSHPGDFRAALKSLRSHGGLDGTQSQEFVKRHFIATRSFETYLSKVSEVCTGFKVSPYEFSLRGGGNLDATNWRRWSITARPARRLRRRVRSRDSPSLRFQSDRLLLYRPGSALPPLLLASRLKAVLDAPVLVGGTILSRIYERGVLRPGWFAKYFDVIVRNEGEKPCEAILRNIRDGSPITAGVPSIVYVSEGRLVASPQCPPLRPHELPVPNFDGLPLDEYVSAEITLPLLSSRGCYWGKCEFCHHGMVYGENTRPHDLIRPVHRQAISEKYGVSHFSFNDEAIPPKLVRQIGALFPAHEQSNWSFTALIKFEKNFKPEDFENLYRVGFRSLYVGLESGSERVLSLMRKNNTRETMTRNLTDATRAGIWMHCFLFFGFPGETEVDAQETYDFVISRSSVIGSIGCGTFSLEHNAPIFKHFADFGVSLAESSRNSIDVYYAYETAAGITPERASEWADLLNGEALTVPQYRAASWVVREHLLCLLARMSPRGSSSRVVALAVGAVACNGHAPGVHQLERPERPVFVDRKPLERPGIEAVGQLRETCGLPSPE